MAYSSSVVFGVYEMKTWFDHGLLSYDKFLKRHRPSRREGGLSNMVGEIFLISEMKSSFSPHSLRWR